MKKMMMTLAAVLCCAMTSTVFTACGDDDDNTPELPKVVAYQVDYSLVFPEKTIEGKDTIGNLYLLCKKIEVCYVDENGQEQRETVNNGSWAKSVTYNKSVDGYVKFYLTKPDNIDENSLAYQKYRNFYQATPSGVSGVTLIYNDGTRVKNASTNIQSSSATTWVTVGKNKLQQHFDNSFKEEVSVMTFKLNI